jgi:hypothetical protein
MTAKSSTATSSPGTGCIPLLTKASVPMYQVSGTASTTVAGKSYWYLLVAFEYLEDNRSASTTTRTRVPVDSNQREQKSIEER